MLKILPTSLTLLNLLFGSLALFYVSLKEDFLIGWYFLLVASTFDFLDGIVARLLKAESAFGAELDSLSDMVTFGVFPAIFWLMFFNQHQADLSKPIYNVLHGVSLDIVAILLGLMYVISTALRLARFNVEPTSKDHFKGLPSPAAALLVVSSLLFLHNEFNLYVWFLILFFTSLSMVIPVRIEPIKLKTKHSKYLLLILIVLGVTFIGILGWKGIPFLLVAYYFLGIAFYQLRQKGVN